MDFLIDRSTLRNNIKIAGMETANNISVKENILEQLASFDFNAPVKVNVIFEDESEEENLATEVKTQTKEKETKLQQDIDHIENNNMHSFSASECSQMNANLVPQNTQFILNKSKQLSYYDKVNYHQHLKRKNTEEVSHQSKVSRRKTRNDFLSNNSGIASENEKNMPVQQTITNRENLSSCTENSQNNNDGTNPEMTCITNLLKSLSNYLIAILDSYSKFIQLRNSKNPSQPDVEQHYSHFLRLKYHYFSLSYCTVENIILPQEKNLFFTGKFLNDTVKMAAQKNRLLCLETQVAPLFAELLQWSKQKKSAFEMQLNTLENNTERNQVNSLLKQQLQQTSIALNGPSAGTGLTDINLSQNTHNTSPASVMTNSMSNANIIPPISHQRNPNIGHIFDRNNDFGAQKKSSVYPPTRTGVLESVSRVENGNAEHFKSFIPSAPVMSSVSSNDTKVPPWMRQMSTILNTSNPNIENRANSISNNVPRDNTDNSKSVLFTTGPPGRQVSITVEQSLLQTNVSYDTTISAPNTAVGQNLRNVNFQQTSSDQPRLPPSYDQTTKPTQNHINQASQYYMQQMTQQRIPSHYPSLQSNTVNAQASTAAEQNFVELLNQAAQLATQGQPNQTSLYKPEQQQSPEMTRSMSTDSGFMSPVNFNFSTEMVKDNVEETGDMLPTPLITHITSLHPQAHRIAEGPCYVCRKLTRKMCVGCFKQYYCSPSCQRFDWNIHKNTCKPSS